MTGWHVVTLLDCACHGAKIRYECSCGVKSQCWHSTEQAKEMAEAHRHPTVFM